MKTRHAQDYWSHMTAGTLIYIVAVSLGAAIAGVIGIVLVQILYLIAIAFLFYRLVK